MGLPVDLDAVRLFLRLLLGLLLLSTAISKLAHPSIFRQGIQDYKVLPRKLEARLSLSRFLSFGIPLAELVAGLGLISGFFLLPSVILAIGLFVVFSGALLLNLLRGRTDLSCHCGGTLGEHRISWWLVGRNLLFILCGFFVLITPSDPFTTDTILRRSSSLSATIWVSTALPVVLLVLGVLAVSILLNAAQVVLRPR